MQFKNTHLIALYITYNILNVTFVPAHRKSAAPYTSFSITVSESSALPLLSLYSLFVQLLCMIYVQKFYFFGDIDLLTYCQAINTQSHSENFTGRFLPATQRWSVLLKREFCFAYTTFWSNDYVRLRKAKLLIERMNLSGCVEGLLRRIWTCILHQDSYFPE